jgi:predicted acyl esterase
VSHSIRIDRDVEMKTRDGVVLRADVWRPDI